MAFSREVGLLFGGEIIITLFITIGWYIFSCNSVEIILLFSLIKSPLQMLQLPP